MAEEEQSVAAGTVDTVLEKFRNLPAAQEAGVEPPQLPPSDRQLPPSDRLFGRRRSVHDLLGGGRGADIILWREWKISAAILASVTIVYVVFEWYGCHVLSVLSMGALIVFGALFVWSNVAAFVKRSPLDVPRPHVSEETALHVGTVLRDQVNLLSGMLREVVLGKDIKLFLQIELALWLLTLVGKWADFLTLVYVGVLLVLVVPVLYERHEDKVDRSLQQGYEHTRKLHGKVQDQLQNRIPQLAGRQKKAE